MIKKILASLVLLSLSSHSLANDSIFYGVWGSDTRSFQAIWGNIMITPDKIYWARTNDIHWRHDLENYGCSSGYEIDFKHKGVTFPNNQNKTTNGNTQYTVARFKLTSKECNYSKIRNTTHSKNIGYFMFASPSYSLGGHAKVIEYKNNEKYMGYSSVHKINHLNN